MSRAQELANEAQECLFQAISDAESLGHPLCGPTQRSDARRSHDEAVTALAELSAYCESLEKDAGRLDWLENVADTTIHRDHSTVSSASSNYIELRIPLHVSAKWEFGCLQEEPTPTLRAAIDASQALDGGK